ncbi:MAG: single-stranded DNA-binding protein [Candidatus Odinarchaeia archaeon]
MSEDSSTEQEFITVGELSPNSKGINLKVKVVSVAEEREVISRKTGETLRVCEAVVGDETGTVLLTLWNEDIDKIDSDKIVQVENGYVSLFKGYMRLNVGKYGTLTEIEEDEFGEVNMDKNMSEQQYQVQNYRKPRYNSYNRSSYRRPYNKRY